MLAGEDLQSRPAENLDQADALLFGRVTYEMMEAAWRGRERGLMSTRSWCPGWRALGARCSRGYRNVLSKLDGSVIANHERITIA